MPTKPMGNRLCVHGETLLRNDHHIGGRLLPLSVFLGDLEALYVRPFIDDRIFDYALCLHPFPLLSNLLHKRLIKLLLQPNQ